MLGKDLAYISKCGSVCDMSYLGGKATLEIQKPQTPQIHQTKTKAKPKEDPNQTNLIKVSCNVFC